MKPKDPDTFIGIGVSITRLLLMASGQGTAASLIGEGAGLLRNLRSGGQRAVSAEKIAADVADRLLREHQGISEADWHAAATHVAPLIDRLSEEDRLAAGYNWEALHSALLDLGGKERRRKLADESARRAFDWVLDVACQRVADLFTEKEALVSLLEKVDEVQSGVRQLLDRPAGASKTRDVVNDHIEMLRELAPDRLEDRESEMANLEAFVRSSDDVWYAMEADMVSGKTAVMASFALKFAINPPEGVHMASFFIRRIGGDGNDRGRFAFVMGAQLADILGDEYVERVHEQAQRTEFCKLLRRAATACRSDTVPQTLVLLIDGVDEDSYFENPGGADAESIVSLLPRHLLKGVKIITASRPNPRLPEDVRCDAKRRIVFLKSSPIAEKNINRYDIEAFFGSYIAVDIVAFLAACDGALTVKDLRKLLTIRESQRILTWDVRAQVSRSPGRMMTSINVGFGGQEVLAYRLGHDVVTRAVIRELDLDSFGEGDEPEDERWWAPIREKALAPYRAIIRDWVKECASRGWGESTPSYVLSGACFDLMLNDKLDDASSIRVVLAQGRYNEILRRSGRKSYALRMIDREYLKVLDTNSGEILEKVLDTNSGEILEDTMPALLEVTELRGLPMWTSIYVPGLLELYVSHFGITSEAALDMILSVDDPKGRLDALRETMGAVIDSGCGYAFLALFLNVIRFLMFYQEVRDGVLHLLADVLVFIGSAANDSKAEDNGSVNLEDWLSKILVSMKIEEISSQSLSSFKGIDGLNNDAHKVALLIIAEDVAGRIKDPRERAKALAGVAGALAHAGQTDRAQRVVKDAVNVAGRIEDPRERAKALADAAGALVDTNQLDKALEVGERIEVSEERARALAEVAGALARKDQVDRSLDLLKHIGEPWECVGTLEDWARAETMVDVAGALARAGRTGEAFEVIKQIEECEGNMRAVIEGVHMPFGMDQTDRILDAASQVEGSSMRVRALIKVADALVETDKNKARKIAEDAVNATEQIKEPEGRVRILMKVVRALAYAGQTDNAVKVIGQIKESEKRAEALMEVAGALARTDRIDEALGVAERIEYPRKRVRALVETAGALARAGEVNGAQRVAENAVNVAEQTEYPWERVESLAEAVGVLVRTDQFDRAVEMVKRIERPEERGRLLVKMADTLVEMGQTDGASRVAETAGRIVGLTDPRILVDVAGVLARTGEVNGARRVAGDAEKAAERIEEASVRSEALVDVVGALARAGLTNEALAVAERIEDPEEHARALAEAAGALARAGAIDEAREIVTMINEPSSRSRAQSAVIKVLVGKGSFDEAVDVLRAAIAEVEGFVSRQDAADCCATLAAACVDAADLLVDSVDAKPAERDRWLGLARSELARSWLYGAPVWNRFDVLLRVAPDLATRLVEERLLAEPESASPASSVEVASPEELEGPEGPGGGALSSR